MAVCVLYAFSLFQAFLLAVALSADALLAAFAYGSRKIKIPIRSVLLISIICSGFLGLTLLLGSRITTLISGQTAAWLGFAILFILGLFRILDSVLKNWIRKRGASNKEMKLRAFQLKFILQVYIEPEVADIDGSRTLSVGEAAALAVALSLDGIAAGLGTGLGGAALLPAAGFTLAMTLAAVLIGCKLGDKLAQKIDKDLSWLSGTLLILLAVFAVL